MDTFYLTFGSQYPREPHPRWEGASHEGWVEVVAPDYDAARAVVVERFGYAWSMLYMSREWAGAESARWYQLGCIGTLSGDHDGLVQEDLRQPVDGVYPRALCHLVTTGALFIAPIASVCGQSLSPLGSFTLAAEEVTCSPCKMRPEFRAAQGETT